jgi:hypothetical protein
MRHALAFAMLAAALFSARSASAVPLFHFSADASLGFGQYTELAVPADPTQPIVSSGQKFGVGSNLEAAVGLPLGFEFGLRTGVRFGDAAINSAADTYGRLFDKESFDLGGDSLANPELRLRSAMFDLKVVEIGSEIRAAVPTATHAFDDPNAPHSSFGLEGGIPVRIHIPGIARIDTGFFLPAVFASDTTVAFDIPGQLWIQVNDLFVGPMVGFHYTQITNEPDEKDVLAGIGGGYTFLGFLDVKAQLYTPRINDSNWSKLLGGGLGVGLNVP